MAEVPSTRLLALGAVAPHFSLPDARGSVAGLHDVAGPKGLVVAFLCNHCPYVLHLAAALGEFADTCIAKGVGFVAINSNDVARYPADAPDKMVLTAERFGWRFPYLYDESQAVARAYCAACTPDFFVFDADLKLAYCGQFDGSRPGRAAAATGSDLREAVRRVLHGEAALETQIPSVGCNIKWKAGNEPEWFSR